MVTNSFLNKVSAPKCIYTGVEGTVLMAMIRIQKDLDKLRQESEANRNAIRKVQGTQHRQA